MLCLQNVGRDIEDAVPYRFAGRDIEDAVPYRFAERGNITALLMLY